MLLRNYIRDKLAAYYAQPSNSVIGYYDGKSINFSSLWGEAHFRYLHRKLYKARKGQWMTPVELFKPYYSYCFADYIAMDLRAKQQEHSNPSRFSKVEVIELGAGRGTNANLFLKRWQDRFPDLYEKVLYTVLDSSPTLHACQQKVLQAGSHDPKVNFKLVDLMDVAENRVKLVDSSDIPTYVMAFEVLDNLPHDKISYSTECNNSGDFSMMQAEITQRPHDPSNEYDVVETFVTLRDPLLQSIVEAVPKVLAPLKTSGAIRWIPSVACGVLHHLFQCRGDMHVILADFDWLPTFPDAPTVSPGSPLITCMNGIDHSCYIAAPDLCDILFPTDFDFLAKFIRATITDASFKSNNDDSCRHHISIMKQGDFLNMIGEVHIKSTQSWLTGYSPLLGDFANCSVLTACNNPSSLKF
jgi:hypothetical protein